MRRLLFALEKIWPVLFVLLMGLWLLFTVWCFVGCGPAPKPRPPQPPPGVPSWTLTLTSEPSGAVITAVDGPTRDLCTTPCTVTLPQQGFTVRAHKDGFTDPAWQPVTLTANRTVAFMLTASGPPPAKLAGRIRVSNARLVNDAGFVDWYGVSEFELLHLALTGNRAAVLARLDEDVKYQHSNVRVFGSASILFHLTPDDPGYDQALAWFLEQTAARALYVEFVVFCDAQILYPHDADRERVLRHLLTTFRAQQGIVWSLVNEAAFNGWTEADDPKLLALAEITAGILGHRDFIVSDPKDGDDPDASAGTIAKSITIARHANLLALHPSRKGGAAPVDGRYRRWIDHLEGATDLLAKVRQATGRDILVVLNEPMGHASQRFVPIPGRPPYEREYEADAAIAAYLTAKIAGLPYTYHRIAFQDAGTPGREEIATIVGRVPVDGQYLNDSWAGSPSHGFTGWGKVRWRVHGNHAVGMAVGITKGAITFANGFTRSGAPVLDRAHVQLLEAVR